MFSESGCLDACLPGILVLSCLFLSRVPLATFNWTVTHITHRVPSKQTKMFRDSPKKPGPGSHPNCGGSHMFPQPAQLAEVITVGGGGACSEPLVGAVRTGPAALCFSPAHAK